MASCAPAARVTRPPTRSIGCSRACATSRAAPDNDRDFAPLPIMIGISRRDTLQWIDAHASHVLVSMRSGAGGCIVARTMMRRTFLHGAAAGGAAAILPRRASGAAHRRPIYQQLR